MPTFILPPLAAAKRKPMEGFNVLVPTQPQHTNVCFWYLPPGIRYMEDKEERKKHLHKVTQRLLIGSQLATVTRF